MEGRVKRGKERWKGMEGRKIGREGAGWQGENGGEKGGRREGGQEGEGKKKKERERERERERKKETADRETAERKQS